MSPCLDAEIRDALVAMNRFEADQGRMPAWRTVRRRSVLGLAAAAPMLVACAISQDSPRRGPVSPVPVLLHTRWTGRPDGPIPVRGDEDAPIQVTAVHGAAPSVTGGALVGNLPDEPAATYVYQSLTSKVRRIGAVFGFEPGSTSSAFGLIAWVPWADHIAHCHVAFATDRWIAATVENGKLDEFAGADYPTPLIADGRPYRVEVVIEGSTTYISLPDGTSTNSESEAVGRLTGTAPCWEFYRHDTGGAAVRIYETWAG